MQKIVVHAAGGYERLVLETHPEPVPGPGEVLVALEAAGVNYADCLVRMGLYASAKEYVGWPITPGFDVAGRVLALGAGVTDLALGDAVLGVTRFGAYATALALPRAQLFRTPAGWSAARAAAFPTAFLTAWYALVHLARAERGARVLVHSAAGGVGGALLQLARVRGCRVVAVVGAQRKLDGLRALAGDALIEAVASEREDPWRACKRAAPAGFDAIFDANGASTLRKSYRSLAPAGRLVVYGFHSMLARGRGRPRLGKLLVAWLRTPRFDPLAMTRDNKSVLAFNLSFLFHRRELLAQAMGELLAWVDAGLLVEPPIERFPLARAADAQRALETGATVGKLVLVAGD